MRTISSNAMKAVYKSQSGCAFFAILKISHTSWSDSIYIVNNNEHITYDTKVYIPFAFKFTPPSESKNGVSDPAKVIIDNVDRNIVTLIRGINTPATIESAIIMVDESGTVTKEAGWWSFELRNVTYTAFQLSGDLLYNISLLDLVSRRTYNNIDFPGLY